MRSPLIISVCLCPLILLGTAIRAQSYNQVHKNAIVVDTHNDILSLGIEKGYSFDQDLRNKTYSDLQRMHTGGVDVQIFSVWCDESEKNPFQFANREIDTLYAWAGRNPNAMKIVKNPHDLSKAIKQHQLASMMGVEGGHMIENDPAKLDSLYKRGVRYMTLTWNNSTSWATSARDETHDSLLHQPKGLNDFGKQLVKRMNALGMMIDLSHVGEQTFWDAINTTTKPVIVSHSCVYSLCPFFRNLKDDQIKAVGKNGGVIHLNFYSGFLDSNFFKRQELFFKNHRSTYDSLIKTGQQPFFAEDYIFEKYKEEAQSLRPPLSLLIDHIDYIVRLIGVDHVGLGSDFDGITSSPQQLDDVTDFPLITKALMERGYSKKDIKKILGENFMRVFKANTTQ